MQWQQIWGTSIKDRKSGNCCGQQHEMEKKEVKGEKVEEKNGSGFEGDLKRLKLTRQDSICYTNSRT